MIKNYTLVWHATPPKSSESPNSKKNKLDKVVVLGNNYQEISEDTTEEFGIGKVRKDQWKSRRDSMNNHEGRDVDEYLKKIMDAMFTDAAGEGAS